MSDTPKSTQTKEPESDEVLRKLYGGHAKLSRVGKFVLVHLDNPSDAVIAKRVAEFDPYEFFFDECPLCSIAKEEGGHIVYDGVTDNTVSYEQDGVTYSETVDSEELEAAGEVHDKLRGQRDGTST